MTIKLNSYLSFNGNAKQAMEFYQSIFGGQIYADTFAKFASEAMPVAEEDRDKIMHAFLKGDNDIELMASDTPKGIPFQSGAQVSLALNGDDETVLRSYWDKLSQDGTITMPLDIAPWGDTFGMVTDKFGINWMIAIGPVQY